MLIPLKLYTPLHSTPLHSTPLHTTLAGSDVTRLASNLDTNAFNFALVRIKEIIDKSNTIKFCFVKSQVSERSERASRKTSILAMDLAKWLQA